MDDELEQVYVGPPNQAEIVRSVLEGNGIDAMLRGSGASGAYPINVGALAETHVLVAAQDAEDARQLLRVDEAPSSDRQIREPEDRITGTYALRRSVMRWVALVVLIVTIASLVTTLDLG